jgi:hypothetical protein
MSGSRAAGAFDDFLLPPTAFAAKRQAGELGLAVPDRFDAWRDERLEILERRLREVAALACLYGMLPRVRITELLAEVHGWTWFCRALRPPQSHRRRFLRRLAAYPRQNALARALREIGCLERTLFILDWISDPALRRRSTLGSTKTRPETRSPVPCFSIVKARSGTASSKISATGPLVSTSRSPPSPLEHRLSQPRRRRASRPRRRGPPRTTRLGTHSVLMATTSDRPNRSRMGFGRCEITAPRSSMLLSVRFGTNSAMTPSCAVLVVGPAAQRRLPTGAEFAPDKAAFQ